jgi:exodeoxyribonuclease V gamma subunit
LEEIIKFFANPAKYFLVERIGLRLEESEEILCENEPFDLDHLEAYKLKDECVRLELSPAGKRPEWREILARGTFPLGASGETLFHSLQSAAAAFCDTVRPRITEAPHSVPVDLSLGSFRLQGTLGPIHGKRLLLFRCASIKGKDRIRAWLRHLTACVLLEKDVFEETVLAHRDGIVKIPRVEGPLPKLGSLLDLYWTGLSQPIRFFPGSAYQYARYAINRSSSLKMSPLEAAKKAWYGSEYERGVRGEKEDSYYRFLYRDDLPLDQEFEATAMKVFETLVQCQETE